MASNRGSSFNPLMFLTKVGGRTTPLQVRKNGVVFSQGDAAEAVFYIQSGKVKLTVVSQQGKEAVVAILQPGRFLGEGCLAGQLVRMATAIAVEDSALVRIDKDAMLRVLHEVPAFAELFTAYLLTHLIRIREDLMDQLFNSSEKRLARVLLLMAHFGKEGRPDLPPEN